MVRVVLFCKTYIFDGVNKKMAWVYLVIAGLLEVGWAVGLKYTEGWTGFYPSLLTAATMIASFYFLSLSLKTLHIGTAYAVWTGIGTVGAAISGILIFGETREVSKVVCVLLIVAGIAGLKLTSTH